jgi:hypothetical protein
VRRHIHRIRLYALPHSLDSLPELLTAGVAGAGIAFGVRPSGFRVIQDKTDGLPFCAFLASSKASRSSVLRGISATRPNRRPFCVGVLISPLLPWSKSTLAHVKLTASTPRNPVQRSKRYASSLCPLPREDSAIRLRLRGALATWGSRPASSRFLS